MNEIDKYLEGNRIRQGPRNVLWSGGAKKKLERSEQSENRRGVQGPTVGPLVGVRGEPPEAQRF